MKCTADDCWFKPNTEFNLDPSDGEKVKVMPFRKFGKCWHKLRSQTGLSVWNRKDRSHGGLILLRRTIWQDNFFFLPLNFSGFLIKHSQFTVGVCPNTQMRSLQRWNWACGDKASFITHNTQRVRAITSSLRLMRSRLVLGRTAHAGGFGIGPNGWSVLALTAPAAWRRAHAETEGKGRRNRWEKDKWKRQRNNVNDSGEMTDRKTKKKSEKWWV